MMYKKFGKKCKTNQSILVIVSSLFLISFGVDSFGQESTFSADETPSMQRSMSSSPTDRNRFEEMFIWKMSEELDLEVKEEKKLSEIIKTNNRLRAKISLDTEEVLKRLGSAKNKNERELLLGQYKKLLAQNSQLLLNEVDQLNREIGIDKAAKYFVLKNEMAQKLKSLVMTPDKNRSNKPEDSKIKIIQEK